jgi:hypothetical protein
MICSPTGSPAPVNPPGTEIAGCPVALLEERYHIDAIRIARQSGWIARFK